MTPEQTNCLEYLKNFILTTQLPDFPEMTQEERQRAWDSMPENIKSMWIEMILGYQKGNPILKEIIEQKKKNHSDTSFGMIVKGILSQYKC